MRRDGALDAQALTASAHSTANENRDLVAPVLSLTEDPPIWGIVPDVQNP